MFKAFFSVSLLVLLLGCTSSSSNTEQIVVKKGVFGLSLVEYYSPKPNLNPAQRTDLVLTLYNQGIDPANDVDITLLNEDDFKITGDEADNNVIYVDKILPLEVYEAYFELKSPSVGSSTIYPIIEYCYDYTTIGLVDTKIIDNKIYDPGTTVILPQQKTSSNSPMQFSYSINSPIVISEDGGSKFFQINLLNKDSGYIKTRFIEPGDIVFSFDTSSIKSTNVDESVVSRFSLEPANLVMEQEGKSEVEEEDLPKNDNEKSIDKRLVEVRVQLDSDADYFASSGDNRFLLKHKIKVTYFENGVEKTKLINSGDRLLIDTDRYFGLPGLCNPASDDYSPNDPSYDSSCEKYKNKEWDGTSNWGKNKDLVVELPSNTVMTHWQVGSCGDDPTDITTGVGVDYWGGCTRGKDSFGTVVIYVEDKSYSLEGISDNYDKIKSEFLSTDQKINFDKIFNLTTFSTDGKIITSFVDENLFCSDQVEDKLICIYDKTLPSSGISMSITPTFTGIRDASGDEVEDKLDTQLSLETYSTYRYCDRTDYLTISSVSD